MINNQEMQDLFKVKITNEIMDKTPNYLQVNMKCFFVMQDKNFIGFSYKPMQDELQIPFDVLQEMEKHKMNLITKEIGLKETTKKPSVFVFSFDVSFGFDIHPALQVKSPLLNDFVCVMVHGYYPVFLKKKVFKKVVFSKDLEGFKLMVMINHRYLEIPLNLFFSYSINKVYVLRDLYSVKILYNVIIENHDYDPTFEIITELKKMFDEVIHGNIEPKKKILSGVIEIDWGPEIDVPEIVDLTNLLDEIAMNPESK